MASKKKREEEPEDSIRKSDKLAHLEAEALDTAAGAVAGATVGAIAGPIGVAAGATIGAAVGALVGVSLEREDRKAAAHDRELDAIGQDEKKDKAKGKSNKK